MFARVYPSVPLIPAATGSLCQSDDLRLPDVCCHPQPKPANPTGLTLANAVRYRQFGEGEPNAVNSIIFSRIIVKKGRFSQRCMCTAPKAVLPGSPKPPNPTRLTSFDTETYGDIGRGEPNAINWIIFSRIIVEKGRLSQRCMCTAAKAILSASPKPPNPTGLTSFDTETYGEIGGGEPNAVISIVFSRLVAKKADFSRRCMCRAPCLIPRFDGLAAYRFPATTLPAVGKTSSGRRHRGAAGA